MDFVMMPITQSLPNFEIYFALFSILGALLGFVVATMMIGYDFFKDKRYVLLEKL